MSGIGIAVVAASVAASMAFLVKAGVGPRLRAALRTTAVLAIGWCLAYQAERPISLSALSGRVWAMFALSAMAVASAWWLHFCGRQLTKPAAAAPADKINLFIAAAFALLLLFDPSSQRYGFGTLLLVAGALILAGNRQ